MDRITFPATFTLFPFLPTELRLKIYKQILALTNTPRILKIFYSPSLNRYISNTAPPILLSLSSESRAYTLQTYTYLSLGLSTLSKPHPSSNTHLHSQQTLTSPLPIPICYTSDTLYISSLFPLLSTHLHDFLWNLLTSPSRHAIHSLAIDLRVFNTLCENGFLVVLARMRELKEVCLVVEFGRCFEGELGFLEAPEWRRDLGWVAERAGRELGEERQRVRSAAKGKGREVEKVRVRCVILTRGGEQA